jgi:hypothetical protein
MILVIIACGARTNVDGNSAGDGSHAPHDTCRSTDGIRICGGECPPISAPTCPGYGCTPAFDFEAARSSEYGVCWSDRADESARPCGACREGEVCIQRAANELVCTSRAVCDALAEIGAAHVCRYTDLSPYDGRQLAVQSGSCPGQQFVVCGGVCGGCTSGVCTGRSPLHAFGLCNRQAITMTVPLTCAQCGGTCAAFEGPGVPQTLGYAYGICMLIQDCLAVAKIVRVGCYLDGQRVP